MNELKTTDGERLIWWRETADKDYWAGMFIKTIKSSHAKAHLARPPLLIRLLEKHLPKHGKVIEAGCGNGWIVAALQQRGFDIEGIDYSTNLVSEVQQLYPQLPIKVGNVLSIDAPDNYYAAYISIGVIEHTFEGCEPFLKEAYRVVQPGGTLCITVPYFNPIRQVKVLLGRYKYLRKASLPFYQYAFKRDFFCKVSQQAGFTVSGFAFYGAGGGFSQELPGLAKFIFRQRGLWRLQSIMNNSISSPLLAHMMMIIIEKPLSG